MSLTSTYLGMELRTPLVPASSPLSGDIDSIRRMEDAGASAVVLFSLFEEQLSMEQHELHHHLTLGTESFAEATTFFPEPSKFHLGPDSYLNHIRRAKEAVNIPIIASLNGASLGGWVDYASKFEEAGADALELNIYYFPTDSSHSPQQVEQRYIEILNAIRLAVRIPIAVKLSPFFSNMAYMAKTLEEAGADGLVLFNRFYQPDIDIENLEMLRQPILSGPQDALLPLTWIGILFGRVKTDLAATSGIQTGKDAIKMIMVGADVTMMAAALLRNGIDHLRTMEREMIEWMEEHEYESVEQMKGSMSQIHSPDPSAFERANYIGTLQSFQINQNRGEQPVSENLPHFPQPFKKNG
ncbi:dihydroorotate dehydrogenase-like protein [Nitrospinota bacterium]